MPNGGALKENSAITSSPPNREHSQLVPQLPPGEGCLLYVPAVPIPAATRGCILHAQWEPAIVSQPLLGYLELGLLPKSCWCFLGCSWEDPSFPWFSPPLHPSPP